MMAKIEICSLKLYSLIAELENMNEKSFRAKQVYEWLHKKNKWDFNEMTNLSKDLRNKLNESFFITEGTIAEKLTSDDNTSKYLFRLSNNSIIESVLMKHTFGNSVCVSSQAGCNMGCAFCYSTKDGKERDITTGEMLLQVYKIQEDLGERISHVVIMGSGEPLENYENCLNFIEILSSKEGLNISQRHITLSTCGLVDKIYNLADRKLQINLALSLHASNDEMRKHIMPIARAYSMEEIFKACDYYAEKTGRRITYEYALMKGINDGEKTASELAKRLKGRLCHVNLIPVNETEDKKFERPSQKTIKEFADILEKSGVATTIRREMGSSINAACGQLRGRYTRENE